MRNVRLVSGFVTWAPSFMLAWVTTPVAGLCMAALSVAFSPLAVLSSASFGFCFDFFCVCFCCELGGGSNVN